MMGQQQTAPSINIQDVTLRYNDSNKPILNALNMDIPASNWTCILGRSGCGKSSLLRYLASLLNTKVQFSGSLSTSSEIDLKEQVAYMAQQDLLMPWLTVLENVLLSEKFSINTKNCKVINSNKLIKQSSYYSKWD